MNVIEKLRNADNALVERAKIIDYLLSSTHPEGKSKAKFFAQFGFSELRPEQLELSLKTHGQTQPVVETKSTEHGVKHILECKVKTPDGRDPCIRSVWIIDAGKTLPRLVTAYPS
jgi:hypothetical protein